MGASKSKAAPVDPEIAKLEAELKAAEAAVAGMAVGMGAPSMPSGLMGNRGDLEAEEQVDADELEELEAELEGLGDGPEDAELLDELERLGSPGAAEQHAGHAASDREAAAADGEAAAAEEEEAESDGTKAQGS